MALKIRRRRKRKTAKSQGTKAGGVGKKTQSALFKVGNFKHTKDTVHSGKTPISMLLESQAKVLDQLLLATESSFPGSVKVEITKTIENPGSEAGGASPSLTAEEERELAGRLVQEVENDGSDVDTLCKTYGLKREELGRLTGFSLRALAEWASGRLPSQPAKRRLREVRRLLDALAEIVKRESIPRWLHQPSQAFGGLTPLQVIELGEIDRLWAMVHDLGTGQPE
ncbi:MAG TPA: hypothetical protein VEC99_17485 [Clostridia bacterium]|nr:hypothetical protein [Clostridia bacterium]